MSKNELRSRKLIDSDIQVGIMTRVIFYWVFCLVFIACPLAFVKTYSDPSQLWTTHLMSVFREHWIVFTALTLIIPVAFVDIVRFSHRFVGPVFRLRQELAKLKTGEKMNRVQSRSNDFWVELSDGFNQLNDRIEALESELEEKQSQLENARS